MAIPTSREEFKQYCLRRLGAPVLEINVDDDQVEDRIDYALKYYADYHFDGTEKVYYKHQITANNHSDAVYDLTIVSGGTGYSNGASLTFSGGGAGTGAAGTISTNANGTITSVTLTDNGGDYATAPTVTAPGGTGASITAQLGGWIPMPQNIIGAIRIFDLGSALSTRNMFSIQYQIALNDLYTLTSISMVPYYMTIQHLQLIEQILTGHQPIRYNRHKNRLYVDMNWDRLDNGQFLVVEAYEVVDPEEFTDVWGDQWLIRYTAAQIKQQWGTNMMKFSGMSLPGGIQFNGRQYYDDATEEILQLEAEMIESFSLPCMNFMG